MFSLLLIQIGIVLTGCGSNFGNNGVTLKSLPGQKA